MIVLGIVLLVAGYLIPIPLLATIGWVLIIVGLVLLLLGVFGHPVAGRRWY